MLPQEPKEGDYSAYIAQLHKKSSTPSSLRKHIAPEQTSKQQPLPYFDKAPEHKLYSTPSLLRVDNSPQRDLASEQLQTVVNGRGGVPPKQATNIKSHLSPKVQSKLRVLSFFYAFILIVLGVTVFYLGFQDMPYLSILYEQPTVASAVVLFFFAIHKAFMVVTETYYIRKQYKDKQQ